MPGPAARFAMKADHWQHGTKMIGMACIQKSESREYEPVAQWQEGKGSYHHRRMGPAKATRTSIVSRLACFLLSPTKG